MTSSSTTHLTSLLVGAVLLLATIGCGDASGDTTTDTTTSASDGDPTIVARWGDTTITLADLDKAAMGGENGDVYQKLYDARKKTLDAMIADKLTQLESDELGITPREVIQQQITDKIPQATPAEVQAFYDKNKAQINGDFEDVRVQIERYVFEQNRVGVLREYRGRLESKYDVSTSLDPIRFAVEVADNDPRKGPDNAPIRVVEWSDFQCPFCARVGPAIQQVIDTYGDQVQVVFRDYPLPANMHPQAQVSAEAGQCAHEQGRFWDMHDKMFANQRALTAEQLKGYAKELELDEAAFNECLDSGRQREAVLADHGEGLSIGVRGTPAIFINGRRLQGAASFDAFKVIIDEELAAGS